MSPDRAARRANAAGPRHDGGGAATRTRPREIVSPRAKVRLSAEEIVRDYRIAVRSRAASVLGRREVLTGKAPFGIFGDGKEIANLAMARAFREGDWRSGYYRDQTFIFAAGMATLEEFFAQLYADADVGREPNSGGRQMVSHFATRVLDEQGRWKRAVEMKNTASDMSPVSAQMGRLVGLAYASKLYRQLPELAPAAPGFSVNGDEVAFGTVGNAGCAEGIFWEATNAIGVLQVPAIISIWDDGYGISVPNEYQVTKSDISEVLKGFQRDGGPGYDIYVARGSDYLGLVDIYALAAERARAEHVPALVHVIEMTQPQGHSTSGSHERYKSRERLEFETTADPISRMREWMVGEEVATAEQLDAWEKEDRRTVDEIAEKAFADSQRPMREERDRVLAMIEAASGGDETVAALVAELRGAEPSRRATHSTATRALFALRGRDDEPTRALATFVKEHRAENDRRFNSHLYSESADSPLKVPEITPTYSESSLAVDGRLVLVRCFDANLARDPRIFAIGEDVGKLGDVNLAFEGLQAKHGKLRVTDTGIREATILGQGIGAAMRGLRPIVEIQYLDYLLYALQLASDDLATLHYRTAGGQKAPVIIRTRGHRLQGIWHTGSPMATILGALRGIRVCVPRDMTQAAGMYNTLLRSDDPALLIEVLNAYRIKERVPDNVGDFTIPLGVPQVIRSGSDLTLVTYGALCRIAMEAATLLAEMGIEAEVVDVRTLEPFDLRHVIAGSVERTGALLVVDEDVPGGGSAFILQHVLQPQGAFDLLEAAPRCLSARPNRVPVGNDGDHFAKPNREDIVREAYAIVRERHPQDYPALP